MASALAPVFAALAERMHATLEGGCLGSLSSCQRLFCGWAASNRRPLLQLPGSSQAPQPALQLATSNHAAAAGSSGGSMRLSASQPGCAAAADVASALAAAETQYAQLASCHDGARASLAPGAADLAQLSRSACMVLLQQAAAVAAVLQAAASGEAGLGEVVVQLKRSSGSPAEELNYPRPGTPSV